ncbi:MAG: hypothetical protein IPP49_12140 [Saprospiraceae bacterium]|nr:hypothetical protein [Saprospiraceae bacterium]
MNAPGSPTFSDLDEGNYTLTIKDKNGCIFHHYKTDICRDSGYYRLENDLTVALGDSILPKVGSDLTNEYILD